MAPVPTLIVLFAAHFLGGLAAFGSTLLALPLLLLIGWETRPAVALLVMVGLVQATLVACLTWRGVRGRTLLHILVVAGVGIPIGFLIGNVLPRRGLDMLLGLLLMAAGASRLLEHWGRKEYRPPNWLMNALLIVGGIVHGAFGSGGVTLTIYGRYALKDKEAFRGTLSVMWVVMNLFVLAGLVMEGHLGPPVSAAAMPGAFAVVLATWLGHRMARRLSQEQFTNAVAVLLCVAGVLTIGRNVMWGAWGR